MDDDQIEVLFTAPDGLSSVGNLGFAGGPAFFMAGLHQLFLDPFGDRPFDLLLLFRRQVLQIQLRSSPWT